MSNFCWILDNSHGGFIHGIYQTAGKRSPKWEDGSQLFEGDFTRNIVRRIVKLCEQAGIETIQLVESNEDVSLLERVTRANMIFNRKLQNEGKKCILVTIHANESNDPNMGGWTVYTSTGESISDKIATIFYHQMKNTFPNEKMRSDLHDGDADWEANFQLIYATAMPSIMTENFYMTNERECKELLMKDSNRQKIAEAHFNAILEVEKNISF